MRDEKPVFFDNAWRDRDGRVVDPPARTYEMVSREIASQLERSTLNLEAIERFTKSGQDRQVDIQRGYYNLRMDHITALEAERDAIRAKDEQK